VLTQKNRQEGRHFLARRVCHGHKGELRQRYREGKTSSQRWGSW